MRLRAYNIVSDAIERGIHRGYRRAYKYVDDPGEDAIKTEVFNAVMGELCDIIDWDTGEDLDISEDTLEIEGQEELP